MADIQIDSFVQDPNGFLRGASFKSGRIEVRETAERCFRTLDSKLQANDTAGLDKRVKKAKGKVVTDLIRGVMGMGGKLRITAYRGDWLHLEEQVSQILTGLAYAAMFESENFDVETQSASLARLAQEMDCIEPLETTLTPVSADNLAMSAMDVLVRAVSWAESKYLESYQADWEEEELRKGLSGGVPKPRDGAVRRNEDALRKLESALEEMPGHIGTLLTGSFAVDNQRDSFSDLDVFAVFEDFPKSYARDELLFRLGLKPDFRFGGFEYLSLDGADVPCRKQTWCLSRELRHFAESRGGDLAGFQYCII